MSVVDPESLSAVETYSGREDPQTWLDHLQAIATLYHWNEALCTKIGLLQLRDEARLWARRHHFASWLEFCQQLHRRFGETTEAAAASLQQCFQQQDESPHAFADRYLWYAAKSGRCEDPALVYSFTQRLLPELREEVLRQRPHTIADAVAFCDYWLTTQADVDTQADFDTWQPHDSHSPDQSSRDLPNDCDTVVCHSLLGQYEYALHFQECSPVDESTYTWPSKLELLEQRLHRLDEHFEMQELLHAKDLEIMALKAALAEQDQQQHKQHSPCSVYDPDLSFDPLDPSGDDHCLAMLACTPVAETPAAGVRAAHLAAQQPAPLCPGTCVHLTPTCCGVYECVCASPLAMAAPVSSHIVAATAQPTCYNSSNMAPEVLLAPPYFKPSPSCLLEGPSDGDKASPSGCCHAPPLCTPCDKPPDLNIHHALMLNELPQAMFPWLEETFPLLVDFTQDYDGNPSDQLPSKHTDFNVTHPIQCGHPTHKMAWSKVPKDPGRQPPYSKQQI